MKNGLKSEPEHEVKQATVEVREVMTTNNTGIFIFIPIGIPGMGKTHFASNYLEQSLRTLDPKGHFTVLSFDQIRKNCLDAWIKDNRGGKIDDGLKATSKELTSRWLAELQEALTRATRD